MCSAGPAAGSASPSPFPGAAPRACWACLPTSNTPGREGSTAGPGLGKEEAKTSLEPGGPGTPCEGPSPEVPHTVHVMAGTSGPRWMGSWKGRRADLRECLVRGCKHSAHVDTCWEGAEPACLSLFPGGPPAPSGHSRHSSACHRNVHLPGSGHYRQKQPRLKLPQTALLKRPAHSTEKV